MPRTRHPSRTSDRRHRTNTSTQRFPALRAYIRPAKVGFTYSSPIKSLDNRAGDTSGIIERHLHSSTSTLVPTHSCSTVRTTGGLTTDSTLIDHSYLFRPLSRHNTFGLLHKLNLDFPDDHGEIIGRLGSVSSTGRPPASSGIAAVDKGVLGDCNTHAHLRPPEIQSESTSQRRAFEMASTASFAQFGAGIPISTQATADCEDDVSTVLSSGADLEGPARLYSNEDDVATVIEGQEDAISEPGIHASDTSSLYPHDSISVFGRGLTPELSPTTIAFPNSSSSQPRPLKVPHAVAKARLREAEARYEELTVEERTLAEEFANAFFVSARTATLALHVSHLPTPSSTASFPASVEDPARGHPSWKEIIETGLHIVEVLIIEAQLAGRTGFNSRGTTRLEKLRGALVLERIRLRDQPEEVRTARIREVRVDSSALGSATGEGRGTRRKRRKTWGRSVRRMGRLVRHETVLERASS